MIDSLICGHRFNCRTVDSYLLNNFQVRKILFSTNKLLYTVKSLKLRKEYKKGIPQYNYIVKVCDRNNSRRYTLFKFFRVSGYSNAFDFKFNSELSHFNTFAEYHKFILGIGGDSIFWRELINNSRVANIHLKVDVKKEIKLFTKYLDYPFSRNPEILENFESGKQTIYLSPNYYAYQREERVRVEKRYNRSNDIQEQLNITIFSDLDKTQLKMIKPFSDLIFYNPKKTIKPIPTKYLKIYKQFLRILGSNEFFLRNTKNGVVRIRKNSFLNAREFLSKHSGFNFSKDLLPHFKKINFNINKHFEQQRKSFFLWEKI